MGVGRLGVKKVILLDKDVVDSSNLNRQILFRHEDVGKPKATTGKIRLEEQHKINPDMQVEAYQMCALENWQTIVEISKEATVCFNTIDVGDNFDAAVQSLCIKRGIPYIQGGTFCQQLNVDFCRPTDPCISCMSHTYKPEMLEKLKPSVIESVPDLKWLPHDDHPIGQSNIYLCTVCAQMMVSRFASLLLADPEVEIQQRFIMTVNNGDVFQFNVERDPACIFCSDPKH